MYLKQPCPECGGHVDWYCTIGDEIADKPDLCDTDLAEVEVTLAYTSCGHEQTQTARLNARDDAMDELCSLIERRHENPLLMYSDVRRQWENSLAALAAVRRGLEGER